MKDVVPCINGRIKPEYLCIFEVLTMKKKIGFMVFKNLG